MFGAYSGLFRTLERSESMASKDLGLSFLESADRVIKVRQYDEETGLTTSTDIRLAIVRPTKTDMPKKSDVKIFSSIKSPGLIRKSLSNFSGIIAVDLETQGTQAADPEQTIVGIGIASLDYCAYYDLSLNSDSANQAVLDWLTEYQEPIVGHNVFFDGTWLLRETGKWLNWKYDTYGLYRQLANEGYAGHSYGLKRAQLDLLDWPTKGDVELDQWLVDNGYHSNSKKKETPDYYPGPEAADGTPRWYKASKGEMWRAPANILGFYCGLDAISTLHLLVYVFLPSCEGQPWEEEFLKYHKDTFMKNVELHGHQQLTGITIDRPRLEKHKVVLEREIEECTRAFLEHESVREYADLLNEAATQEIRSKEPEKFKKQKPLGTEPARYTKSGAESKNWIKWDERRRELEETGPEVSKNWLNWEERLSAASQVEHFNLNSSDQLAGLFYEHLGHEVLVRTKSDKPSVGVNALPGFGEPGRLLKETRDREKELGYVNACLEHLIDDGEGNWRLHPQFRMPGTLTCRLAGSGGLNLQQIPKSRRYLECWRPRKGRAWVDFDFTALEQVVMAELTRDESLYKLYGPGAKKNDVYLFNGALMARDFGIKLFQPFLDGGYSPDNPDPEAISKVKKEHKNLRGIAKTASLGKAYGMGWAKFRAGMKLQGINLTEKEAKAVIYGLDKVYSGIGKYNDYLVEEHSENNGWVLNGIGRPVCCADDYIKDIVNRVVQSTGHDVLMVWMTIFSRMLDEAGVDWDGIVLDFHDQSIIECDEKDVETVVEIMKIKSVDALNETLDGVIKLTVDGGPIETMADAKCE